MRKKSCVQDENESDDAGMAERKTGGRCRWSMMIRWGMGGEWSSRAKVGKGEKRWRVMGRRA